MLLSPLGQREPLWVLSEAILGNVGLHYLSSKYKMQEEGQVDTAKKQTTTLCEKCVKMYY